MTKRFAILIGISDYSHVGGAANLRYASGDAKRLASILVANGQIPANHIYMLADHLGKDQNAFHCKHPTRANILEACKYVFEKAEPEDFVLFYFAGHGLEIESRPYLLTGDTKMDLVRETALDVVPLETLLAPSKAQFNLKIFDACRSGYSDGRLADSRMTAGFQQALLKTGTGWASISACSSGEVAYEDPDFQHGVFTHFFCEALTQTPPEGSVAVTLENAVDRLKTSMATWCDLKTRRQTPQFKSDISGILDLSFAGPTFPQTALAEGLPDPIREFYNRINQHLDSTPTGIRNFAFTDKAELDKIAEQLFSIAEDTWGKFAHPAISITIDDPQPLQHLGKAWAALHDKVRKTQLNNELTGDLIGRRVSFKGAEVALPDASLVIAPIRFKHFYWIWRTFTFESAIKEWNPKQPADSSFYALKPQSAHDPEILKRISSDFMAFTLKTYEDWAKQLATYLSSRLKPFQDAGHIIQ